MMRKGTEELQSGDARKHIMRSIEEGRHGWLMGELGRAGPSRDVMLSPKVRPDRRLLHPNPPSCRSRTGVRTRVMTKGGKRAGCCSTYLFARRWG